MNCFYHSDRAAVAQCSVCKKGFCRSCVATLETIRCKDCLEKRRNQLQREINYYKDSEEKRRKKKRNLAIVLFVGVFIYSLSMPYGALQDIPIYLRVPANFLLAYSAAGIPYGWDVLMDIWPVRKKSTGEGSIWIVGTEAYTSLAMLEMMWTLFKIVIILDASMVLGWFFLSRKIISWLKKRKKDL